MKYLSILLFSLKLCAVISIPSDTKQLLIVSTHGFENNQALLQAYERSLTQWKKVFLPVSVNLGRNGLGWGKGLQKFKHQDNEPLKREGDGKSPAGLFSIGPLFGYEKQSFSLPYLQVDKNTLCIDDSEALEYNQIIDEKDHTRFKSFEFMKRKDDLYRLGILVKHNEKRVEQLGSCIFIHIQKAQSSPTSGCTSMHQEELYKIMNWLQESDRPLLLQVPKAYLEQGFE